jgi:translocation and assembly module TamA
VSVPPAFRLLLKPCNVRIKTVLLMGMLSIFACGPAAAAYRVEIAAPAPLKDLLNRYLDLVRYSDRAGLNEDQFNFMLATAATQVSQIAATEGYFLPKTEVTVDRAANPPLVHVNVDPGARTLVAHIEIGIGGAVMAQSPQQAAQVRRTWSLREGEPFRQEDWAAAKQRGLQILQRRRYPAARIADSDARIYPDLRQADLTVDYDSGPLFTLGPLNVTGTSRYPADIVRNVNPLHPGEEYNADRLQELQREILRTPYFSNAEVTVGRDPAHAQETPVNVHVTEFPEQRIRTGFGYATDTGAHLEGRYSYYNLFDRAWVPDTQARLEQRRQTATVELALPPDTGAYVNSANTAFDRTTLEGVDLRSRRFGLRRARNTEKRDFAYTLTYYNDSLQVTTGAALPTDIVALPGTQRALVAGLALTRRQVNNVRYPRRGYTASVEAGVALKGLLTDDTFFRAYSRVRQYNPIGRRDVLILRGEAGAVVARAGDPAIPASLLFRAGGTESVRGYRFQSIGRVVNGVVYPTRYLATGGAEYQHWLTEQWGAAVFYDVGTATDQWSGKRFFHGVGAGARWRSPVGVINADLAYGFQEGGGIRPHFSLGVVF